MMTINRSLHAKPSYLRESVTGTRLPDLTKKSKHICNERILLFKESNPRGNVFPSYDREIYELARKKIFLYENQRFYLERTLYTNEMSVSDAKFPVVGSNDVNFD